MSKTLVVCVCLVLCQFGKGQYTYFNVLHGQGEISPETTTNIEVIGDEYFTFGLRVIDGINYETVWKLNEDGDVLDQNNIYFPDEFHYVGLSNSFIRTPNENSFMFTQAKIDSSNVKGFAMKIDAESLDTLWSKQYDHYAPQTYFYTHSWDENGFILAGEFGENPGERGTFIMKVDLEGNVLWHEVLHSPSEGIFRNFTITPYEDGYLLSGATGGGSSTEGYIEYYTEQNGLEWHTLGEGGLRRTTMRHAEIQSGEVLVFQSIAYEDIPGDPLWVYVKIRLSSLNLGTGQLTTLSEIFMDYEFIRGGAGELLEVDDGFVFVGQTYKNTSGTFHRVSNIFKLNLAYELEWFTELSFNPCVSCENAIWDMEKAPDGGYVLAGFFRDYSLGGYDHSWLVKVDACGELEYNGCWPVGMEDLSEINLFKKKLSVFPNPAHDHLELNVSHIEERIDQNDVSIEIYNALGISVYKRNGIEQIIDVSSFSEGNYKLLFRSGTTTFHASFSILR